MKSKNYSVRLSMIFKKYYCSKCGTRLKKEKTHRVVTKKDWDYYRYHNAGTFPERDYDVYDHRWKCPGCEARISFREQCIMERIQKKNGSRILSSSDIKANYRECKQKEAKGVLVRGIVMGIACGLFVATWSWFFGEKNSNSLENKFMLC